MFDLKLLEDLRSREAATRRSAARLLAASADASAVEPLLWALDDPDEWVRVEAVSGLGKLYKPRALQPLIAVADRDPGPSARERVAWALGEMGDPRARVRRSAADVLSRD